MTTLTKTETTSFFQYRNNAPTGGYPTFWGWAKQTLPVSVYNAYVMWYVGSNQVSGMEGLATAHDLQGENEEGIFTIDGDPNHPRPHLT